MNNLALSASIYKSPLGDSTNNGASSRYSSMYIASDDYNLDGYIDLTRDVNPIPDDEILVIIKRDLGWTCFPIAVPKSVLDSGASYMFGGNFVFTSDSRFQRVNNSNPIKIFDRVE